MPNDAKLGLLAGVIGVIAIAVLTANRPPTAANAVAATKNAQPPITQPRETPAPAEPPLAPSEESAPIPVGRTKTEPEAVPASRSTKAGAR